MNDIILTAYFAGGTITSTNKYYSLGSATVMNDNGVMRYLLTDHQGSTVSVLNSSGSPVSHQRYYAFGGIRPDLSGTSNQTDFGYTGQRNMSSIGLMDYKARFYDPVLGRFLQPDTIIPSQTYSQAWNRYAYTFNNPIKYNDPNGHDPKPPFCWPTCSIADTAVTLLCYLCSAVGTVTTLTGGVVDRKGIEWANTHMDTSSSAIVAAGMAVQSQWINEFADSKMFNKSTSSGIGPAQVSDAQMETYGLGGQNQEIPSVAIAAMTQRISMAVDACKQCVNGTDRLIVAAIAQNGVPPYTFKNLPKIPGSVTMNGSNIDWVKYLNGPMSDPNDPTNIADFRQWISGKDYSTKFMLQLYSQDLSVLLEQGYQLPDEYQDANLEYIKQLTGNK